jgi:prepilin-type N-terminal cleavage/methylation domain-containing protein
MKNTNSQIKKKRGFTIVETLVAISILSISITATFTAVQNGLRSSLVAKDQTTAFYLAQEAVEYIKNIRDENALYNINVAIEESGTERDWLDGIASSVSDPCYFGKVCIIDSPAKTVTFCDSAPIDTVPPYKCDNLRQNEDTGLFGYNSGWDLTNFKREIQIEEIVPNEEVRVVVSVSWTGSAGPRFFQITETLLNRQ